MIRVAIATLPKLFPNLADQLAGGTSPASTEWWQLVPGSIYDGDTLRVARDGQELKVRLCGIDAPEMEQPGGVESRDHLRSLVAQGNDAIGVVPIEEDQYGRLVADLVVMRSDDSEVHLNSQMVADGVAYRYARYSNTCSQPDVLVRAEEQAKSTGAGLWVKPRIERPWNYRKSLL